MRFISVCSGIEAASVAWAPLGWKAAAFSEIEPFPCALLAHRFPDVPNLGDMTRYQEWPDLGPVGLLCGGTPCQSFSVAGLRGGLDDPRGNLMLTFGATAARYRPRWLVWENVPGVLSSNGGRDFGAFLGLLVELGYGFAFRVLDAQYAGVPQRRRRVFVVGCLGDWRRAAAVLFERHSLQGHPAPRREAREGTTSRAGCRPAVGRGVAYGGNNTSGPIDVATALNACASASGRMDFESETFIAHTLTGTCRAATEDGTGRGTPLVPVGFNARQDPDHWYERTGPIDTDGFTQAVAFAENFDAIRDVPVAPAMTTAGYKPTQNAGGMMAVATSNEGGHADSSRKSGTAVRRLTPVECERLMGFPDSWTAVPFRGKPAADGPRYKALGNSWAVPCARWVGERIAAVERIAAQEVAA